MSDTREALQDTIDRLGERVAYYRDSEVPALRSNADGWAARAEAAEAREAALRARIEAVAPSLCRCTSIPHGPTCPARVVLTALASPAEDATPAEPQAEGGACQGDPAFGNGGCCPSCKGVGGGGSMGACWDCRGTGHPHENSPAPVAGPSEQQAQGGITEAAWHAWHGDAPVADPSGDTEESR